MTDRRIADRCRNPGTDGDGSTPLVTVVSVLEHVEEVLRHDGVTEVVKVGLTVRRPARAFTATIQAYLGHLHAEGIDFVPEPLGYDEQGREVLSYVSGDVPVEPLPDWATTDEVLGNLARLLRQLHDASEGWNPPPDAVWGGIPGHENVTVRPLFDRPELVSHQDYCPGNVVFRDGRPAGIIDFDLARPTTRVSDCVNALYWWAPLLDPIDRVSALQGVDVARRLALFADAYGMSSCQRGDVVPVAVQRAKNSLVTLSAAAEADPTFKRWWEAGWHERSQRAVRWLEEQSPQFAIALSPGYLAGSPNN